jgi:hypothetical protein
VKRIVSILFLVFASVLLAGAQTEAPKAQAAQAPPTASSVLDRSLAQLEQEIVSAAEAMPEDKYGFVPTNGEFKGVRDFAGQIKHTAAVNNLIFSAMLGEQAPAEGEDGPKSVKTKAEIVKYLRDSFLLGHRAMTAIGQQNLVAPVKNPFGGGNATRLGLAVGAVGHSFDHYGQVVEYLRMNGIIPPASRR